MMRIIDLAVKDLRQVVRDRKSALFLVAMPIVFMLFFSLIFGAQGAQRDPRLPVGFVNHDLASSVSTDLFSLLEGSDAIRPVVLDQKQAGKAGELVRDGKLAAALIVPDGFGQVALAARQPKLTLIVAADNPAGQTASNAVDAAVTRLLANVQIAQLSAQAFETSAQLASETERQAYLEQALTLSNAAWRNPPLSVTVEGAGATERDQPSWQNAYNQTSPGTIIQFTIYSLIMCAGVLVSERKSGAMQRLLTTPISRAQIIAGHTLGMLVVVLAQQAVLIAFSYFVLGIQYLRVPLAILLVAGAYALWVVSLGMLIGAVARSDDQVVMWSLIAMFVFSALGGAWFPLEFTGKAFAAIGHLTPSAWAMDGFQNIIMRGLGLSSVLLPVGILLAYAAAFFALAVWRFRFE